ncbi:MAG: type II secretion system protein [Patescibacteria group bacterium]|jgi:prepilin-type N-terminal cleavage/methylation domain-containing protein
MKKNRKGFTLIELLVVIAIIGLLSTLAIVSLNSARQKSRDTKRMADMRTMQSALELYANELGGYPVVGAASTWTTVGTAVAPYLASGQLPQPPNSTCAADANPLDTDCYVYCTNGTGTQYLVGSHNEQGGANSINGDVDGALVTYTAVNECVTNAGVVNAVPAFSCDDPNFCLGKL